MEKVTGFGGLFVRARASRKRCQNGMAIISARLYDPEGNAIELGEPAGRDGTPGV
jgi:hypothetical protein